MKCVFRFKKETGIYLTWTKTGLPTDCEWVVRYPPALDSYVLLDKKICSVTDAEFFDFSHLAQIRISPSLGKSHSVAS